MICQHTMLSNINIARAEKSIKSSIRVAKAVFFTRGLRLGYSPPRENEKTREACLSVRLVSCVR